MSRVWQVVIYRQTNFIGVFICICQFFCSVFFVIINLNIWKFGIWKYIYIKKDSEIIKTPLKAKLLKLVSMSFFIFYNDLLLLLLLDHLRSNITFNQIYIKKMVGAHMVHSSSHERCLLPSSGVYDISQHPKKLFYHVDGSVAMFSS
jgi:hypothetical protein